MSVVGCKSKINYLVTSKQPAERNFYHCNSLSLKYALLYARPYRAPGDDTFKPFTAIVAREIASHFHQLVKFAFLATVSSITHCFSPGKWRECLCLPWFGMDWCPGGYEVRHEESNDVCTVYEIMGARVEMGLVIYLRELRPEDRCWAGVVLVLGRKERGQCRR